MNNVFKDLKGVHILFSIESDRNEMAKSIERDIYKTGYITLKKIHELFVRYRVIHSYLMGSEDPYNSKYEESYGWLYADNHIDFYTYEIERVTCNCARSKDFYIFLPTPSKLERELVIRHTGAVTGIAYEERFDEKDILSVSRDPEFSCTGKIGDLIIEMIEDECCITRKYPGINSPVCEWRMKK